MHRLSAVGFLWATVADLSTTIIGLEAYGLSEQSALPATVYGAVGPLGLVAVVGVLTLWIVRTTRVLYRLPWRVGSVLSIGLLIGGTAVKTVAAVSNLLLVV